MVVLRDTKKWFMWVLQGNRPAPKVLTSLTYVTEICILLTFGLIITEHCWILKILLALQSLFWVSSKLATVRTYMPRNMIL